MHVTPLLVNVEKRLYEDNREDVVDPRKKFPVRDEVQFTKWDKSQIGQRGKQVPSE